MRWPVFILIALLAALQYPLWFGKGGWLRVWEVNRQLAGQRETNQKLESRNAGLEAEVRDLKAGLDAIEERARFELGLTRPGELFVQIPAQALDPNVAASNPPPRPDAGKNEGRKNEPRKPEVRPAEARKSEPIRPSPARSEEPPRKLTPAQILGDE